MKSSSIVAAYSTEARHTYFSLTGVLILPIGVAFSFGFLGGFAAFSFLWSLAILFAIPTVIVIRLSLVCAAFCALYAWVWVIRWVNGKITDTEQFTAALVAGRVSTGSPLIIEYVSDNGRKIERERVPFTQDQLKAAAEILLPKRGRFDLRSLYPIFGQPDAHKFRDWLVNHPKNYAIIDNRGWVSITQDGLAFLRAAKTPAPPAPPSGEVVPLYASRR